jgi:hypothetical protein
MALSWSGSGSLPVRLGKLFYAQEVLNTARGTTVPAEVEDALDEFAAVSPELEAAVAGLPPALNNFKTNTDTLQSALKTAIENTCIQMVKDDVALPAYDIASVLREIIRQMIADTEAVEENAVGASVSAVGSPAGNGTFVVSTKRADGLVNELMLAETIQIEATAATSFRLKAPVAARNLLSESWPAGSGKSATVTVTTGGGLITNGGFEDEDDQANFPDDWIKVLGTIGTTIKLTDVEVQTVAISGTPTDGYYTLSYTNAASQVQTTALIAYNAPASTVQSRLRALKGLELVTVAATGTSPNYTHTITFNGVGGNVTQLTSTSYLTGGSPSIAHNTTTAGSTHVYGDGKALEFDSNGSELTEILVPLSLSPQTQYAFNGQFKVDSVPAAGVLQVSLWDGGAVINDDEGTANTLTISATGLTTSYAAKNVAFRTPRVLPPQVYLRYRISTAVSNTSSVFADDFSLVAMTQIYSGGPSVAAFEGNIAWAIGDRYGLAVTNDRAGEFHEWMDRNFDLKAKGLLLPTTSGVGITIPDSLIS